MRMPSSFCSFRSFRTFIPYLVGFTGLAALAGCGDAKDSSASGPGSVRQAIVGGTTDDDTDEANVVVRLNGAAGLVLASKAILTWGALPHDDPRQGLLAHRYERDVHTFLVPGPGREEDALHNLAYTTDTLEKRLVVFEAEYETPRAMVHAVHREGKGAPGATERRKG